MDLQGALLSLLQNCRSKFFLLSICEEKNVMENRSRCVVEILKMYKYLTHVRSSADKFRQIIAKKSCNKVPHFGQA